MAGEIEQLIALLQRATRGHQQWPLGQGSVDEQPWPGASPPPPNVPPAATGSASLSAPAGLAARPQSYTNIVNWRSTLGPYPVVVLVDIASGLGRTAAMPYQAEAGFFSQNAGAVGTAYQLGGVMRLTYGLGNGLRTLEADLRNGTYQIPPCDYCNVDAYFWMQGPQAPVQISASVIPGQKLNPARLTSTTRMTIAAGTNQVEAVPWGARWVSLSGGAPTGVGVGQPKLRALQQNGGLFILQDYDAGVFVGAPGAPLELTSRDAINVYNDGPASVVAHLKFFLET